MGILEILNPWWKEGKVSRELAPEYRRKVYAELKRLMRTRQIVLISGLRRVGKTTLMFQLIEDLLKKTKPERILYFSFDEKIEDLFELLEEYSELTGVDWKREKCYIFLDEIQKLENWSNKVKLVYDRFPNLKLVLSGSGSFDLERDAMHNLAGRYFTVNVSPLSFQEYLEMSGSEIDISRQKLWEDEIKKAFKEYLFRPFPELIGIHELVLVKSYIQSSVLEKVVKSDLADKFKDVNESILLRLLDEIYSNPGMYLNYDEISKSMGISKKTLIKHLHYLEFSYLIRKVKNYRPGFRAASRKLARLYPYHWALGFGLTGEIDMETVVATLIDAKFYWRKSGKEVDFLVIDDEIIPIEVKSARKIVKSQLRNLIYFMDKFKVNIGVVVYNGDFEVLQLSEKRVIKVPLWMLALHQKHNHLDIRVLLEKTRKKWKEE